MAVKQAVHETFLHRDPTRHPGIKLDGSLNGATGHGATLRSLSLRGQRVPPSEASAAWINIRVSFRCRSSRPCHLTSDMGAVLTFLRCIARACLAVFASLLTRRNAISPTKRLEDWGIHSTTGCIPPDGVQRLTDHFELWESSLDTAQEVLKLSASEPTSEVGEHDPRTMWRRQVRSWPVFDITPLKQDIPMLQRAHMVLAFLVHFYAHSTPPSTAKSSQQVPIPASLAVPLWEISKELGIAPVLTFADTVLWNCESIIPCKPMTINNVRSRTLFTGSIDEDAFYVASARTELLGADILHIIFRYYQLAELRSHTALNAVAECLTQLAEVLDDMIDSLAHVKEGVDPLFFHAAIRPWFVGSSAQRVWIYEGVAEKALDLDGPSTGQSTAIHALDIFLGIDYGVGPIGSPRPSETPGREFMARMRRYMPKQHRDFLEELDVADRPVRRIVQRSSELTEPYNAVVKAVTRLRDVHMRVSMQYIENAAKSQEARCPFAGLEHTAKLSVTGAKPVTKGTGGNELSTLLRATKDATRACTIHPVVRA